MEIIYMNNNGENITLRQRKPLFLQRIDGTGNVRNMVNTFHAPNQDGAFFISGSLEMRNITLEGNIVGETVEDTHQYRRRLLRAFTPKQGGTLVYRNWQISCVVEDIAFSESSSSRAPAFFVSLLCPSPFFETLNEIRAELAAWQRRFTFPLELVAPGIELGSRQPSQIITVVNDSDVPCGMEIVFTALGEITNPELMNVNTGEYIRVNTTLYNGDEYRVYTHFANKRVVKTANNITSNAFSLIDAGSTFLQLNPGENVLRYNVGGGSLDLLECVIHYRPQSLGV